MGTKIYIKNTMISLFAADPILDSLRHVENNPATRMRTDSFAINQ